MQPSEALAAHRDELRVAMKHPERAEDYLAHIAEAIDRVAEYLQPVRDFAGLEADTPRDAVVRNLEIIGEAATQLTAMAPEFPVRHKALPWIEMRGPALTSTMPAR